MHIFFYCALLVVPTKFWGPTLGIKLRMGLQNPNRSAARLAQLVPFPKNNGAHAMGGEERTQRRRMLKSTSVGVH